MEQPTIDILATTLVDLVDQLQDATRLNLQEETIGLISQIEWLVTRIKKAAG